MFLRCSYFLAKSEADVLINSVLTKRKACIDCSWTTSGTHVLSRRFSVVWVVSSSTERQVDPWDMRTEPLAAK